MLSRISSNVVPAEIRGRFKQTFERADRLFVRDIDNPHSVLIDEAVARELLAEALPNETVDQIIAAHSPILTSMGLDPVPLNQLETFGIHLRPGSNDDYARAGLHANSDVQALREAFDRTYPDAAAIIDIDAGDLADLVKTKIQAWSQPSPAIEGPLFAPSVSGGQFWSCMWNHLWAIIAFAVISALGAWGVYIGAIVIVGISSTVLFWLIVGAFGVAVAVITLNCLLAG